MSELSHAHIPVHEGFAGVPRGACSVIIPVSFFFCECPPEWLTGAGAEEMVTRLRAIVEASGFPVVGSSVEYFGNTDEERRMYGATLNLILQDSGISFDCYPPDQFSPVAKVQMNLHYCNITHDNDHKVPDCIERVRQILRPAKPPLQYRPTRMALTYEDALQDPCLHTAED